LSLKLDVDTSRVIGSDALLNSLMDSNVNLN
jgi:hypothetical protein